jgi:glycosyltransferase involved in cell wall biosynthesis
MSHLRVAWIAEVGPGGGGPGFSRQLVETLVDADLDVTLFTSVPADDTDRALGGHAERLRVVSNPPRWERRRWYSRTATSMFLSSLWARRRAYRRTAADLLAHHRKTPFHVIVQFSQAELFEAGRSLHELPPFLLFPGVHAAGELRWHRRETHLALRGEKRHNHAVIRANLAVRTRLQGRSYRAVHGVIGMSRRFNELVAEDYGVEPRNQAVVRQPIQPGPQPLGTPDADGPVRLLFVGRIAVRKGVEMLVELSRRLGDLAGSVELEIVGGRDTWSDYRGVLEDLDLSIANLAGVLPHDEVMRRMARSDILVVPSHYEPGGLVVGEALAAGCVVVASDEVGSAENLPDDVHRIFPRGDAAAFEASVREMVEQVRSRGPQLSERAKAAASRHFDPATTRDRLIAVLETAASRRPISEAPGQSGPDR